MSAVCQPTMATEGWCFGCEDCPAERPWLSERHDIVFGLCEPCFDRWEDDARGLCGFCHKRKAAKDADGEPLYAVDGQGRETAACRRCHKRLPELEAQA